jgi:hypothetical protein
MRRHTFLEVQVLSNKQSSAEKRHMTRRTWSRHVFRSVFDSYVIRNVTYSLHIQSSHTVYTYSHHIQSTHTQTIRQRFDCDRAAISSRFLLYRWINRGFCKNSLREVASLVKHRARARSDQITGRSRKSQKKRRSMRIR